MSTETTWPCSHCTFRWRNVDEYASHLTAEHPIEFAELTERIGVPEVRDRWADRERAIEESRARWGAPPTGGTPPRIGLRNARFVSGVPRNVRFVR
jgi:hypothetical protein